nr:hypothetical protein [uncultured Romboutsia sp.]
MDKRNKITIAIGSAVVLASGVYFLNKSENNGTILDDKYQTIVQNDSKENESNQNDSISVNDNNTSSNAGNSNEPVSNNEEADQTQTGDKSSATSGVSSNKNNSGSSTNTSKPSISEKPNKPSNPVVSEKPKKPSNPEVPDKPSEPSNPVIPEKPNKPSNPVIPEKPTEPSNPEVPDKPSEPVIPDEPSNPEIPEEPEIVVTDLTITKDDLVDGVVTLSNKTYKNISIDSSVANGKVILDNVEVQEKLILEDGVQYQVNINNSKVPYVKVESNDVKRYRNISSNINKNISGPTLHLENVKDVKNVDINGNASIYGDSKISNLNILNGTLLLDVYTTVMTINENSVYADVTINQSVNEINDSGSGTNIGVNGNIGNANLNGKNTNVYIKEGITVKKATINGDFTKVMGNGTLTAVEINGDNVGVYTETPKENIVINEDANNTFIGREDKYEISTITPKQQGKIEFTLNEKTSRALKLSDISIICQGGNSMTIFDVTTKDNKTYTLNTSYYKDNIYELYITLPSGNIISKEFNYSYNHPTSSNVDLNRISPTSAIFDIYGVDEGGYLYYKLVEKTNSRSNNNISLEDIKENGNKVSIKTGYNEISISSLKENKEYDLYYAMEGYDGRTSPVYGPLTLGTYEEKPEANDYTLDYVAEVESNKFVFTFNKPVKGDLKLEDFKIICPSESALTTKGAKFIVSPDKKTYTIIVPDNYGHKDNKYTVSINMPDGSVVEGSFRSHFNPPVISGNNIDRYAKNKMKFKFNSDEHGKLYYGIYEWNNSVIAGDSTTPMSEDVLNGKIKSTEAKLSSGYNELDIDLSGYELTRNSRLWVLYVDYDGNYRNGFVDHYKIPEFTGNTDEEDKSSLDITNIEVDEGWMGTLLNLTFNQDLTSTFGQNNIKIQSLSGANLPGRIGMSVSFPSDKLNYASIELMGVTLSSGDYRITIETYDSEGNPAKIVKDFTVK